MTSKLHAKLDPAVVPPARPAAGAAGRRVFRLGRHWAVAVNWKLTSAVGLALLVWALIVAVAVSL